jgi:hypothetical protein
MLRDMASYDRTLEGFSVPLMAQIQYDMDIEGRLTVKNPREVEPVWRYPDLTAQAEYLYNIIGDTIAAIPAEFEYLKRYDQVRQTIASFVVLSEQRLSSLIDWLQDGRGRLPNNKRKQFSELSPAQVELAENVYADAFGLSQGGPLPQTGSATTGESRKLVR